MLFRSSFTNSPVTAAISIFGVCPGVPGLVVPPSPPGLSGSTGSVPPWFPPELLPFVPVTTSPEVDALLPAGSSASISMLYLVSFFKSFAANVPVCVYLVFI